MYGNFQGFPLEWCIVWVGNKMTPVLCFTDFKFCFNVAGFIGWSWHSILQSSYKTTMLYTWDMWYDIIWIDMIWYDIICMIFTIISCIYTYYLSLTATNIFCHPKTLRRQDTPPCQGLRLCSSSVTRSGALMKNVLDDAVACRGNGRVFLQVGPGWAVSSPRIAWRFN